MINTSCFSSVKVSTETGQLHNLATLERRLEQLYQERQVELARASRRGASQAHRRAADQFNARKIRESQADINRHKRLLSEAFDDLAEHSFPVDKANGHAVQVGGLSLAATRAALAERAADRAIARQPAATLNDTLNTMVRDEQGELSTGRSLGVLVNGSLSLLGGIMFLSALQTLWHGRRDGERFLEHVANVGSHGFGTAAGVMAIREMIVDARHRNLYQGRGFQQVALADARAAAGSPAQLERWARVANKAMGIVAGLGGLAGLIEILRQSQRMKWADTDAERLAAQVALTGAIGVTGGGGFIGSMSLMGRVLGRPAVGWRLLLLKFAGPAGWVVAAGTLLLIAGEVLARRFSLSPVQRWCQRSHWGQRSENWDLETHDRELTRLGDTGFQVARQGQAQSHGGPGLGPAATDLAIRIGLPGPEAPNAENLAVGLWAIGRGYKELTRDLLNHAELETQGSSFALRYHFDPAVLSEFYEFRLVIRSKRFEESTTKVFQLHRRGTALRDEWSPISALGDSFWTRGRVGEWPNMPLKAWQ